MRWILGLGLAVGLGLTSPVTADTLKIDMPAPITVPPLPSGVTPHPVSLTRIAANIAPGTAWSETFPESVFCAGSGAIGYWKESNNKIGSVATFERIFNEQLKMFGFVGSHDTTNLFEEQTKSDLQVGALITDVKLKDCPNLSVVKHSARVTVTMDVEWQIYSVAQGKVVARVNSRGGFYDKAADDNNMGANIGSAFADNVRHLAANEDFRRLVTQATPRPPASAAAAYIPLQFPGAHGETSLTNAVKSVVVIYAGDAAGSGFLISPNGYILTNHHVAGDQGQVRIHWSDGTDTVGEVVRSDRHRDVALIRTTSKAPALSIRTQQTQLGEAVFAVGTPLEKEFQNTLTKGIVSGNRLLDGLAFIQSDVAVDHGNSGGPLLDEKGQVLGLTQWGYAPDGVSHNLNFFIPIADALKALALEPASAAVPPTSVAAAPGRGAAAKRKAR